MAGIKKIPIRPQLPRPNKVSKKFRYLLGLLAAGLFILGVWLIPDHRSSFKPIVYPAGEVIVTPDSYNDFFAEIQDLQANSLVARMSITGDTGQASQKTYLVKLDEKTVIALKSGLDFKTVSTVTPGQLEVGDKVQIFGNEDISQVSEFLAARVNVFRPDQADTNLVTNN